MLIVRLVLPIDMPTPFSLFNMTESALSAFTASHLRLDYTPPPVEKKPVAVVK